MRLRVLGTAAGGGLPQWNCACPGCAGARAHPQLRRRHASLAVEASPGRWYLVNATPDLGEQIEDHAELRPGPALRQTPIAGVILTDAELDHTLGLARLREARGLEVWSTPTVRAALAGPLGLERVLSAYTDLDHRALSSAPQPMDSSAPSAVEISAVPISDKRPRYARGTSGDGNDWVVALRLHNRDSGATLVYAPALGTWSTALGEAVDTADWVLIDGTFWDEDEPARSGLTTSRASAMGHLPVIGPGGTAERLKRSTARCYYTHLNNTNPLNDPDSPESHALAATGLGVAGEGMVIDL